MFSDLLSSIETGESDIIVYSSYIACTSFKSDYSGESWKLELTPEISLIFKLAASMLVTLESSDSTLGEL